MQSKLRRVNGQEPPAAGYIPGRSAEVGKPTGQEDPQEASSGRALCTLLTTRFHEGPAQPVHEEAESTASHQQKQLTVLGIEVHHEGVGVSSHFKDSYTKLCLQISTLNSTLLLHTTPTLSCCSLWGSFVPFSLTPPQLSNSPTISSPSWMACKHIKSSLGTGAIKCLWGVGAARWTRGTEEESS